MTSRPRALTACARPSCRALPSTAPARPPTSLPRATGMWWRRTWRTWRARSTREPAERLACATRRRRQRSRFGPGRRDARAGTLFRLAHPHLGRLHHADTVALAVEERHVETVARYLHGLAKDFATGICDLLHGCFDVVHGDNY